MLVKISLTEITDYLYDLPTDGKLNIWNVSAKFLKDKGWESNKVANFLLDEHRNLVKELLKKIEKERKEGRISSFTIVRNDGYEIDSKEMILEDMIYFLVGCAFNKEGEESKLKFFRSVEENILCLDEEMFEKFCCVLVFKCSLFEEPKLTRYVRDRGIDLYGLIYPFGNQNRKENCFIHIHDIYSPILVLSQIKHVQEKGKSIRIELIHAFNSVVNHFPSNRQKYQDVIEIEYPKSTSIQGLFLTNGKVSSFGKEILRDSGIFLLSGNRFINFVIDVYSKDEINEFLANKDSFINNLYAELVINN